MCYLVPALNYLTNFLSNPAALSNAVTYGKFWFKFRLPLLDLKAPTWDADNLR